MARAAHAERAAAGAGDYDRGRRVVTPVYEALLQQDGIYLDQRHRPHGSEGQNAVPVEEWRAEDTASQPAH